MALFSKNSTDQGIIGLADHRLSPFEDLLNLIAAIAIFILMILGSAQIFLRSALNSPINGYIDLVELSMASMAFLGAAYCQRLGGHIRMEMLVSRLKGRWLWGFEAATTLVALFIIGVLIWYGWDHFVRSYELGDSTIDAEYPVWPSKLLVPIAFSFWFLRLLVQLAGSVRLLINPDQEPVGIAKILDVSEQAQEEIHEAFGDSASSNNDGETAK
ncbi:MAG: TRAP transporter small permease [Rhizobiaceae bacterium]